jgi:hypothetical protein
VSGATLLVLVTPVVLVLVLVRKRSQRGRVRSATVAIEADDDGVRRTLADGRTEEVGWDEVNEVEAFRTRVGPHKPAGGGVVLYGSAERGCIIPFDKLEESALLAHLHNLPGFDLGALITFVGADPSAVAGSDSTLALLSPKPLTSTVTLWARPVVEEPDRSGGSDPTDAEPTDDPDERTDG